MTKAQREKAERLMLKQTLDNNPKLKQMIDALIDNPKPEMLDVVKPVIEEALKKERMIGIKIGWQAAMIQAHEKIKDMKTINSAKILLREEADKVRNELGISGSNFDNKGNLIIEQENNNEN